jgi:hypothetical protein
MHRMIHAHWMMFWIVLLLLIIVIFMLTRKDPKD